jgi:N-acetyl-anhydromuramyl-L-alanine amidase AmpD
MFPIEQSLKLNPVQYVVEKRVPKGICLHHTAGYTASSSIAWWNKNAEKVATPWVIEKNGTKYLCHPEADGWAWHMGSRVTSFERQTIGVEIVNIGFLTLKGNTLFDAYGQKYCSLDEKDKYHKSAPWRGQTYWAAYTDQQIQAVVEVVRAACEAYSLKKLIVTPAMRDVLCASAVMSGGVTIFSHQNIIQYKTDVGPAFPWDKFVDLVQAV